MRPLDGCAPQRFYSPIEPLRDPAYRRASHALTQQCFSHVAHLALRRGTKIGDPTPAHQVGALIVSRLAADLLTPAVRISGILCASGPGSARLGITGCGNADIGSAAER